MAKIQINASTTRALKLILASLFLIGIGGCETVVTVFISILIIGAIIFIIFLIISFVVFEFFIVRSVLNVSNYFDLKQSFKLLLIILFALAPLLIGRILYIIFELPVDLDASSLTLDTATSQSLFESLINNNTFYFLTTLDTAAFWVLVVINAVFYVWKRLTNNNTSVLLKLISIVLILLITTLVFAYSYYKIVKLGSIF